MIINWKTCKHKWVDSETLSQARYRCRVCGVLSSIGPNYKHIPNSVFLTGKKRIIKKGVTI